MPGSSYWPGFFFNYPAVSFTSRWSMLITAPYLFFLTLPLISFVAWPSLWCFGTYFSPMFMISEICLPLIEDLFWFPEFMIRTPASPRVWVVLTADPCRLLPWAGPSYSGFAAKLELLLPLYIGGQPPSLLFSSHLNICINFLFFYNQYLKSAFINHYIQGIKLREKIIAFK